MKRPRNVGGRTSGDVTFWRKMGLKGWSYEDILPYFRKSQGSQNRKNSYHGQNGPLKTEPATNFGIIEKAFILFNILSNFSFSMIFSSLRSNPFEFFLSP